MKLVVEYDGPDDLIDDYKNNLSVGGIFVHTEREIDKGTSVKLLLSFPGLLEPITVSGVVRWSSRGTGDEANGVGIEFVGEERARLQSFVDSIARGDSRLLGRPVHLLVVEDNFHIARLIREGLAQHARDGFPTRVAFEFETAPDGEAAIEILGQRLFDALMIDLHLPGLDGAAVVAAVRQSDEHKDTPVIGISAGDGGEERAMAAGCDYFLAKPLRLRELLDVMNQLLGEPS